MRGPRSIAESMASTQGGKYVPSASASMLSLNTEYRGTRVEDSLMQVPDSRGRATPSIHQPSARTLVERYERMQTPPPTEPLSVGGYKLREAYREENRSPMTRGKDKDQETTNKKDKNRSPLRQSIRNFLATLRKGTIKSGDMAGRDTLKTTLDLANNRRRPRFPDKDSCSNAQTNGRSRGFSISVKPQKATPGLMPQIPTSNDSAPSIQPPQSAHKVDFSGSIWYLFCDSANPYTPATWNLCTGVIKARKLIITWSASTDSAPCVLEIDLVGCSDVRSLANIQLDALELALISEKEDTRDLKIFELVLQGREREKFAVRNLGERAAWVSALWDAILPTEHVENRQFSSQEQLAQKSKCSLNLHPQESQTPLASVYPKEYAENFVEGPAIGTRKVLLPLDSDRSLPPLPAQPVGMPAPIIIPPASLMSKVDIMPRIDSARSPVSPSIYSPSQPPSVAQSPTSSPSILSLGQKSVVKQRLAQIKKEEGERTTSPCSFKSRKPLSPCSPASTTGTCRSEFLSVLSVEENADQRGERIPFEHLSNGNFLQSSRSLISPTILCDEEGAGKSEREGPSLRHDGAACFEPPPANKELTVKKADVIETKLEQLYLGPLLEGLATFKDVLDGEAGQPSLRQVLLGVDNRSRATKRTVEEMVRRIESLQDRSSAAHSSLSRIEARPPDEDTRRTLEAVRRDLTNQMQALMVQLEKITGGQMTEGTRLPSGQHQFCSSSSRQGSLGIIKANLSVPHEKTHVVLAKHPPSLGSRIGPSGPETVLDEIAKINTLIEKDNGQRALQVQQQADSVRYLNELNLWLENFVKNGTAQINGLAANIDHLCKNLCPPSGNASGNLLRDTHALVLELRNQANASSLQVPADKLAETITMNSQNTMNMKALVSFMERQRQEQDGFLRAFTTEISGEIKGERLKFVEAMKEATAINIQMQVDQLRKELASQVLNVALDLGRLESEKRAVETRIANLHAFHAKQKQAFGAPAPLTVTAARPTYRPLSKQPQYSVYTTPHMQQQSRPLPYPRHP